MAGRGVELVFVGGLVVATGKIFVSVTILVDGGFDWKTYPLPSSLALREKMLAKENMIAEENIVAGVGIDAVIRIIVADVGCCLRSGICRINSKRWLCKFKIWLVWK